jgi:hypothetical protein
MMAPFNLIQLDPHRDGRTDSKRNDPCQVVVIESFI